jgi:uncharacterized membrane protein YphA (DoxX/SURF4 family)
MHMAQPLSSWTMPILRIGMGLFVAAWGLDKLMATEVGQRIFSGAYSVELGPTLVRVAGIAEILLGLALAAGLLRAKAAAVELLSGLLVPLSFFPPWAEGLLEWLPFRAIADVPLNLYLGRYAGEEVLFMLALQAAWALGLYALGRLAWRVVVRRLTIQGG